MSDEFHYVRTLGEDGGVDAVDGTAIGLDLEAILEDGLPPLKVALEVIAACCEILDIANEDGESHGNIELKHVFLDETGAVSIEGFGSERKRTAAPEGTPKGHASDLYALGTVAFRLFSPSPMPPVPNDDPDGHDDTIIDSVLGLNFEELPEEFVGDVQWFIAKLLSFDREDRPEAYEAWKTFIAFADGTDGPALDAWGALAVDGGGDRRDSNEAARAMRRPDETEEEDLDGPVQVSSGPLTSGLSFGGGPAKGQVTAFWSKDAMKAALEAKDEDEDDEPAARPPVGAAASTAFWSKAAMQEASQAEQRPKRRATGRQKARPPAAPKPAPAPVASAPPIASGPAVTSPPPVAPASAPPVAVEAPSSGPNMALIGGAVAFIVLALVVCLGLGGIGGIAVMFGGGDVKPSQVEPPKRTPPVRTQDTGHGRGKKADEVKPTKNTKKKSGRKGSSSNRPKPKPKPRSGSTRPKPKPKPKPSGGPARVNFKSNGRGSVSCAGTKKNFDGIATLTIDAFQLPATCLVTVDGKRGVFQVYASGSVTCNVGGGGVNCTPLSVGG